MAPGREETTSVIIAALTVVSQLLQFLLERRQSFQQATDEELDLVRLQTRLAVRELRRCLIEAGIDPRVLYDPA